MITYRYTFHVATSDKSWEEIVYAQCESRAWIVVAAQTQVRVSCSCSTQLIRSITLVGHGQRVRLENTL